MDKYIISVIVPVYNVEDYLEKCLNSLIKQTQKNVEIIVVDDGSTDNSSKICDCYAENNSNIVVVHKENGGLSSARNAGLRIAHGEYIGFVDSDDWVEPNMFEILLRNMIEFGSDLSCCSMSKDYTEEVSTVEIDSSVRKLNRADLFDAILCEPRVYGYVCNKLFRKSLIIEEEFDETLLSQEDMDLCIRYAQKCENTVCVFSELYHYRQRPGAMTSEMNFSIRKVSVLDTYERALNVYEVYCPQDLYIVEANYLKIALNLIGRLKVSKVTDETLTKRLLMIKKQYYSRVVMDKRTSILTKVNIIMTSLFPAAMLRLKQIGVKVLGK